MLRELQGFHARIVAQTQILALEQRRPTTTGFWGFVDRFHWSYEMNRWIKFLQCYQTKVIEA